MSALVLTQQTPLATTEPSATAVVSRPSWLGAVVRRIAWRSAFAVTGGLRVQGTLPSGGCVIVANHSSHADSAALIAAIDASHRPVVAAAADHWFSSRIRSVVCRGAVSGFAVRRTGGGFGDLLAAEDALRAGVAVVIFPEGSRSTDATEFRSGAARLAARAGVPLVPVGIAGTADLLPMRPRRLVPLRSAPVAVRIGRRITVPDEASAATASAAAHTAVRELVAPVAADYDGGLRRAVARFATSRRGLAFAGMWAVGEALSWPLISELLLAVLVVAAPRRAWRLTAAVILGSTIGALIDFYVARSAIALPAPLTTERMHVVVAQETARDGSAAVASQAFSGIPFKVYVQAAGRDRDVEVVSFLAAATGGRALRMSAVAAFFALLGLLGRRARRWYPAYLAFLGFGFTVGLTRIVLAWR